MGYFDLKKGASSPQAASGGSGYFALKNKVAPLVESNRLREEQRRQEELFKKQQETQRKQQEAIQQFQQKQEETQRRSERGGLINFAKNAYQGIKQAVGRGETLPEIQGGSNLYQAYRQSQLAEQDYKKRIFARGSQAVLDFGKKKADTIRESEEERGKLGTVVEAGKGAVKNLGELASGLGKIGLEFSPLTGMSGMRKVVSFVGGQRVEEFLDRSTPEYQKKVVAFVDENNILNYKAQYNNEIQKTGGEVAEIGSWFIPITRLGMVGKLEKAIADIPKVARMLNATPKVVKVGGNLAYEVSKDVIDVAILDAIRGKDWETIKGDAKMAGVGGGVLRAGIGGIGKLISMGKNAKVVKTIESSIGKLDADESKIAEGLIKEGKTTDEVASGIMAKREDLGKPTSTLDDLFDDAVPKTEAKVVETVAPEAPTKPVEAIKPETPVKPPVKEITLKEGTYKSATKDGFMDVKGTSVKIHKDIETFTHKDVNGNWVVSEVNTGKSLNQGGGFPIQKQAIDDARNFVDHYGIDKIKKSIGETPVKSPIKEAGSDLTVEPQSVPVKPKVKAPKQPKESITAKKMNQRLNGVDELSTKYDVVNLNKEINEASSLIEKNKTKAVETVFSDTGSNTQKVAIATELFEKAVVEGDVKTQSLLFDRIKKLSTETAQALNMFKALTVTNPHFKYMKEVVNLRLDKIKIRGEDITRAMNKKTEPIVASITKATKSRVKIVNAQKLLDKLIC